MIDAEDYIFEKLEAKFGKRVVRKKVEQGIYFIFMIPTKIYGELSFAAYSFTLKIYDHHPPTEPIQEFTLYYNDELDEVFDYVDAVCRAQ